jgi:hypothetical protein
MSGGLTTPRQRGFAAAPSIQRGARKRPTCYGRPFPSRVASIGEMHLTFNQGIKARLLGDSGFLLWRGSGRHAERRPFPFAPFPTHRMQAYAAMQPALNRQNRVRLPGVLISPAANAPLRGAAGFAGWTCGFHVRGSGDPPTTPLRGCPPSRCTFHESTSLNLTARCPLVHHRCAYPRWRRTTIGRSLRSGCQCRPAPPSSTGERS